jgi:hypothetical protein
MTRAPARRCGVGSFDYCFSDCGFERDPADCSNEGASYFAITGSAAIVATVPVSANTAITPPSSSKPVPDNEAATGVLGGRPGELAKARQSDPCLAF